MCKVSDKLQLCTCPAAGINELKNYWILHRMVKGKNCYVIGEPLLPFLINESTDKLNRKLLEQLLNNGNVFDTHIQPKNGDRLQLTFCADYLNRDGLHYGFSYKSNEWLPMEYDMFEWERKHEPINFGRIAKALIDEKDEDEVKLSTQNTDKKIPYEFLKKDENGIDYRECVVANIIGKHYYGQNKEIRSGTKHFSPGTKVYCSFPFSGNGHQSIRVMGKPRKSFKMITVIIETRFLKNFRVKNVYRPSVIEYIDSYKTDDDAESNCQLMNTWYGDNKTEIANE